MFKSIQRSGRIAAVAIGLIAALSPLAAPPAALANGSVPTPELEKSYSFKVSSDNSYISTGDNSKFGYLYDFDYDEDDGYNLKSVSLINFNDGSACPIAIPDKGLESGCPTSNNQLYWRDGNNLVVFRQTTKVKQSIPSFRPNMPTPMKPSLTTEKERPSDTMTMNLSLKKSRSMTLSLTS